MTAKQIWGRTALATLASAIAIGAMAWLAPHVIEYFRPTTSKGCPSLICQAGKPVDLPRQAGKPDLRADLPVAIAGQRAKLKLSDGRTATFLFSTGSGSLTCTAAIGLDEVLGYTLSPLSDPPPPAPTPIPTPTPPPTPPPPAPAPTPPVAGNLRVLFTYDPLALAGLPGGQQALLASPALRSYLDRHCPLESGGGGGGQGCASGLCPLAAAKTPSYRFLPSNADVSRLAAVWQQTAAAVAGKPAPWMIAVNEAGQTVIDQAWPASVEETLTLLQKFAGP